MKRIYPIRTYLIFILVFVCQKIVNAQAPPNCPAATGFPATGQTFVVTRTDDWPDPNNSPVVGQLRWAIAQANRCRPTGGGTHRIVFNIPGPGPHVFQPFVMYPRIQSATIIDGFTQPGSSYGNPKIVIDGLIASTGQNNCVNYTAEGYGSYCYNSNGSSDLGRCFEENYDYTLGGSGNNIQWRGLVMHRFKAPIPPLVPIGVIHMNTGSGFVVEGCFIGTDATGTVAMPNDAGITINSPGACTDAPFGNHIIGSTNPALKNIISGNTQWGIQIMKTYNVQILNNYIGIDKNASPLPNGGNGIQMWMWNTNCLIRGNRIEYNGGSGVAVWHSNGCPSQDVYLNRFEGNFINHNGLDGMTFLNTGVHDNIVGVDAGGTGTPNDISNNARNGVYVAEWFDGSSYVGGSARKIQIRKNTITCNGVKAINLNYGSPNPGNQNIQKPSIDLVNSNSSIIVGTGPANKLIDVYQMSSCANCIVSGTQGDALVWMGSTVSNGSGNWSYSAGAPFHGQVSATASDNPGVVTSLNTSEFSTCFYLDPLPVVFLNFDGIHIQSGIELSWTTASEINSHHFDLYRSLDGVTFEWVATIPARGNSASLVPYSFIDYEVPEGYTAYYKLKEVDVDSKSMNSKTISVVPVSQGASSIHPNPASDRIWIESDLKIIQVSIFDLSGRKLDRKEFEWNNDEVLVGKLSSGLYFIEIKKENYQNEILKLIKE